MICKKLTNGFHAGDSSDKLQNALDELNRLSSLDEKLEVILNFDLLSIIS